MVTLNFLDWLRSEVQGGQYGCGSPSLRTPNASIGKIRAQPLHSLLP
ncbi:hypothetical protein ACFCXF_03155 [Streptomyces virginiae]